MPVGAERSGIMEMITRQELRSKLILCEASRYIFSGITILLKRKRSKCLKKYSM